MMSDFLYRDTDTNVDHTRKLLADLELSDIASTDDITVIRYVCSALSIRAAQFVCAGRNKI